MRPPNSPAFPPRRATLFALTAVALLVVGCQHLSGLDDIAFSEGLTSTSSTTTAAAGGGGGAPPCEACDGKCVAGHCCRSGGAFAYHSFLGGLEALQAVFAEVDGTKPMEALFVNQLGEEIMLFSLDPVGPSAKLTQRIKTGRGVTFPATADLDHDGQLDLVLVRSETINLEPLNLLQVHMGLVGGRFDAASTKVDQPGRPMGQLALDLDGDADTDLFFNTETCTTVRWGEPGGTFGPPECVPNFPSSLPVAVVHGGFGARDAALVLSDDSLLLGSFTESGGLVSQRLDVGAELVHAGGVLDLDGDGDDDIAILTRPSSATPSTVLTFLRDGESSLTRCDEMSPPPSLEKLDRPRLGDFDGDRIPDILAMDTFDENHPKTSYDHYRSVNYLFHGVR